MTIKNASSTKSKQIAEMVRRVLESDETPESLTRLMVQSDMAEIRHEVDDILFELTGTFGEMLGIDEPNQYIRNGEYVYS